MAQQVRTLAILPKFLSSIPSTQHGGSQSPVTVVPGDLKPSSGLQGQ